MRSLTENETTMLAEMLGEQDAAIWPIRPGGAGDERIRVQAEIADLRSGGFVFQARRRRRDSKAAGATRASLVELGLATISKPKSTAPRIQLTDRGDTVARVLAGLPTFADSLGLLGQMLKQRGRASNGILDGCAVVRPGTVRIRSPRGSALEAIRRGLHRLGSAVRTVGGQGLCGVLLQPGRDALVYPDRRGPPAGQGATQAGAACRTPLVDVEFDESHWSAYLAAWEGGYWGLASMEVQHPSEIGPGAVPKRSRHPRRSAATTKEGASDVHLTQFFSSLFGRSNPVAENVITTLPDGCTFEACPDIEAVEPDDRPKQRTRRFEMVAYTGVEMGIRGWPHPIAVDLAGLAYADHVPIVLDHKTDSSSSSGRLHPAWRYRRPVDRRGVDPSASPARPRRWWALADGGFLRQASIGVATVQGKTDFILSGRLGEANGRQFKGWSTSAASRISARSVSCPSAPTSRRGRRLPRRSSTTG